MDTATRLIFFEIMIQARNEDMLYPEFIIHGNKNIGYQLKRGQSLFVSAIFKKLGFSRKTIQRSFNLLSDEKSTFNMTFIRQPFGFIVTVLNYDELVKMTFNSTNEVHSKYIQSTFKVHTNNKSVENEETVKSAENIFYMGENFEKLNEIKNNPIFCLQQNQNFNDLTEKEIDNCLLVALEDAKSKNNNLSIGSAFTWLRNENERKKKNIKPETNSTDLPKIATQAELANS
jgi:hypothetical protein